ncbi:N-acetylglucosamine kinase [Pedobacter sp. SD-b]|uniref:N-acetylglucosamine kinase n=1 Tax=Pedobacter segetis TaxID=2793069 RepID=A0ABS1BK77_9SPHI|nr:N-acetylglucosamine kinase [Pedobacter segetis]MBK0383293.1 N-acetylglucosamine kinase [Pedobacter segetis]
MLLVADGGSSKTDWILLNQDQSIERFHTGGLNPFFTTEKEIIKSLQHFQPFKPIAEKITELYFFGAGCSSPDRRELVSNALTGIFKNAFVSVESDTLGSAIATCKDKPGFSCVLGTESNISFFDGKEVFPSKLGLGYILGEEGSGTYFGKILLTDFLYGNAPEEILRSFDETYRINKDMVIKNLYQKPFPNYFIASFAQFMGKHLDHPYVQELLLKGFDDFITTHIRSYPNYKEYYAHFVGSISFYFKDYLKLACTKHQVNIGTIIEKPIEELFTWIKKREGF